MGRVILAVKLNRWVAIRLVYRNAIIGSGDTYYSSAHDSPQYVLGSIFQFSFTSVKVIAIGN
jgi:hypothetical protein